MITEKEGRFRSERTREETLHALENELKNLSAEERIAFKKLLGEIADAPEETPPMLKLLADGEYKTPPVDMRTFLKDPFFLGNSCENLYPKLQDDLIELFDGGYQEVIYTGCIELDAIIQSADGSLRTIREWIGSRGHVTAFSPEGPRSAPTGFAKHSGTLPVVRLELANGMDQRLTPDHKVLCWRDEYAWVPAAELRPDDLVVVARQLPSPETDLVSEDEAKLLAYWCADGSSSEQRSRYCDGNPETSLEVCVLLQTLGFEGSRSSKGDNCWEVYVTEHKRSGFLSWLQSHEAHLPTKQVKVPEAVCRSSNKVVAAFLNRLWAAEGCVYANTEKSTPRFTLGMTSERFVRQVQLLLLRFGIQSRIRFTPQHDKRSGHTTETWLLMVSGVGPLSVMCEKIGPILGKEDAWRRIHAYCAETRANTNVDVLPIKRKWLSEEMTRRGVTRAAKSEWWGLARGTGTYLSRDMFAKWFREFETTELAQELARCFPVEYAFERVVSCDPHGEAEVGDICDVEEFSNFISNGIYSHNSIGWGKCLVGETEVFDTASGRRRRVDELGDLSVPSMTAEGKIESRPAQALASGRKKCLKLTLAAGQHVTLSADHKVFTSRGWVEARDLCLETDRVATPLCLPEQSSFLEVTEQDLHLQAEALRVGGRVPAEYYNLSPSSIQFFLQQLNGGEPVNETSCIRVEGADLAADVSFLLLRLGLHSSRSREGVRVTTRGLESTNELLWQPIISLEDAGEHDVYDLTVPGTHSFVANGIVVHNTFTASIGICRILYEMSCLKDPHKTYGIAKDTNISIVCLSVNETLATKVVFENISTKIKASPYFAENFPFEATKKELRFPKSIWVAARATTDTSALGLNTISALIDESNYMPTKSSKLAERAGSVDHAEIIYNSVKRRMESRFKNKGKLPGMVFVVSSKKTEDDFTAKRVRESNDDPAVFVRDYALWDIKEDNFSKEKFWVLVGNDQTPSKILGDEEEKERIKDTLPENVILIAVPKDFRHDFERDLEGAIRDLAGCSTVAISPFIQRREKILEAVNPVRSHPFTVDVWDPSKPGTFDWTQLVSSEEHPGANGLSIVKYRPLVNPHAPRHIHIDPSLRRDATGFVVVHVNGWKDVKRRADDGKEYLERAPTFYVDFMLRVVPPAGDEIILGDLRRLVYELYSHGFHIGHVSMDSWQSADGLQQLEARGFKTSLLSMDTSTDPYECLKTALYENRVDMYSYETAIRELKQLERDGNKRKIDHPTKGSKDVTDALAGAIFTLTHQQGSTFPLPMIRGESHYGQIWATEQSRLQLSSKSLDTHNVLPILGGHGSFYDEE